MRIELPGGARVEPAETLEGAATAPREDAEEEAVDEAIEGGGGSGACGEGRSGGSFVVRRARGCEAWVGE